MSESRRRLSPDDRRNELLALGAEVFGQRPYDEVRIDEIAERAGVSRALMYHYFPDKRAFFAAVVRAEGERLFEATNAAPDPEAQPVRPGARPVCWPTCATTRSTRTVHGPPTSASAPPTRSCAGIEDVDNDRQANRIIARIHEAIGGELDSKVERDLRITIYGWLAFTFEMCRQRLIDPSIDAAYVADACAHTLLDAIGRVPGVPAELAEAVATEHR